MATIHQTGTNNETLVLNNADTFGVFDMWGNIQEDVNPAFGLYHKDTRFVSVLSFLVNGNLPVMLSSNILEGNEIMKVDLCNQMEKEDGTLNTPQGIIHINRERFLLQGAFFEKLTFINYGQRSYNLDVHFYFASDFKDIFEVRGQEREKRGEYQQPEVDPEGWVISCYHGLDGVNRRCAFHFSPGPQSIDESTATYRFTLGVQEQREIFISIYFRIDELEHERPNYLQALQQIDSKREESYRKIGIIETNNELFNHWLNRSLIDLESLASYTEAGVFPYAGVPWYNTIFGRDGIITAYEVLWAAPYIAQGVLKVLAARQAREVNPRKDAEPGKILHETRNGEMVATEEVPFKNYYGSVDATPLYVMLAAAYFRRTNDRATIEEIWPNVKAALNWIEEYGDTDNDGFVDYYHKAENGLTNQGWKDSFDSISHADGALAEPPIALCEFQAYVYAAKMGAAMLAGEMQEPAFAKKLSREAKDLKRRFNERFWDEELKCFALAIDGAGRTCRVVSSNAGQCLFTGIVDKKLVRPLVSTMMSESMFTGFGIRTLSSQEVRYNPMSYHNGSVWPHDTALIAYGMARYGYPTYTARILSGLFDVTQAANSFRLPELFCGFTRNGAGPISYPVACSPQAWAVASSFMLVQSILGLHIDAIKKEVSFVKPQLPAYIKTLRIRNIFLDEDELDLELVRHQEDVGVNILGKSKNWKVIVTK